VGDDATGVGRPSDWRVEAQTAASARQSFEVKAQERAGLKLNSDGNYRVWRVFKPHAERRPIPCALVADYSFDRDETVGRAPVLGRSQFQHVLLLVVNIHAGAVRPLLQ
jgi:hypothetical protein